MKRKDIRNIVKLAIDNIIVEGCTDVSTFGRPFELNLLKNDETKNKIIEEVVSAIDSILNSNSSFETLKINKISHMLVPKKTFYDFRKCALIDIVDEIKYLSLVLLIANKIEKKRVSDKIAFSYRYNPTKFRKLSKSEIEKLKNEDEDEIIEKLKYDSIIEPEAIIKSIKILISKEKYNNLIVFPEILKKYPQFVPYFSDVIFKCKDNITDKIYKDILEKFGEWLDDNNTPEYILISIVKMFNTKNFEEKRKLFDFFKNLKRNSGIYVARTVLEQIGYNLSRGEILELKDYYLRSDCWEKRQIVNMVLNGLNYPENRPFIKDLKINCNDYFILDMIKNYEKKNRKK